MGEVVGLVSAVLSLLEVTGEVLVEGYSYINKASKAPHQVRTLLNEVSGIDTLLDQLHQRRTERGPRDKALPALSQQGCFNECQGALNEAKKALNQFVEVNGERSRNFGKRLLWPFKDNEVNITLQRLERLRRQLSDALAVDTACVDLNSNRVALTDGIFSERQ